MLRISFSCTKLEAHMLVCVCMVCIALWSLAAGIRIHLHLSVSIRRVQVVSPVQQLLINRLPLGKDLFIVTREIINSTGKCMVSVLSVDKETNTTSAVTAHIGRLTSETAVVISTTQTMFVRTKTNLK